MDKDVGIISADVRNKWCELGYDRFSLIRREGLLSRILKHSPSSVLDVGCGDGADLTLIALTSPQTKLKGIEFNYASFENLHQRLGQVAKADIYGLDFFQDSAAISYNFADSSCDIVFSNAALMYSKHPAITLNEMYRIARKAVILLELNTPFMEKAISRYKTTKKRVALDDVDFTWKNFGFYYEILKLIN